MIFSYVISYLEVDVLSLVMMQRALIREGLLLVYSGLRWSNVGTVKRARLGSKATVLPSYAYLFHDVAYHIALQILTLR